MAFKIKKNISFDYEGNKIKARVPNGKEKIEIESIIRLSYEDKSEDDARKDFYISCVSILAELITDLSVEIDDEGVDWENMEHKDKEEVLFDLPVDSVIGIWIAFNGAISPTEEDKKKLDSTSNSQPTKTPASTKTKNTGKKLDAELHADAQDKN